MNEGLAEVVELQARYDEEPSHSNHVRKLALQMYDALTAWHGLPERMRLVLEAAALLHDIGWSQTPDGRGHHKASARLIRAQVWTGFTAEEVEEMALIARYHRKAIPQPEHADFHALTLEGQERVSICGGLLRLADALDRTHLGRIERVEALASPRALEFFVTAQGLWVEERAMFEVKRDMFERVAARPVVLAGEK